jgi:hypothetical protein
MSRWDYFATWENGACQDGLRSMAMITIDWLTPVTAGRVHADLSIWWADIWFHLTKFYELQLTVNFEMWLWMGCTLEATRKQAAKFFILELHAVNSKRNLSGNHSPGWDTRMECTNPGSHTVATTFVRWCLIYVNPQYENCLMLPVWRPVFWDVS